MTNKPYNPAQEGIDAARQDAEREERIRAEKVEARISD